MSKRRKVWADTEKIPISTPEHIEDEEEVTKPHPLPSFLRSREESASVQDLHDLYDAIWSRIDRVKLASTRRRRDTDDQLKELLPKNKSLAFKIRIIWGVGAFLLALTTANLWTGIKYLYTRGGSDAESSIQLKNLVDTTLEQGRRLRVVEDASIKLIQRIDDFMSRRSRSDRNDPPAHP